MNVKQALDELDALVHQREAAEALLICGGASLILQGVISRDTQDVDVLHPVIDPILTDDITAVAKSLEISTDWVNNGPISLINELPMGWQDRTIPVYQGKALTVTSLGRHEMILTKAFAFCDRGRDREDLLKLNVTPDELASARLWVQDRDANPQWPEWVRDQLTQFAKEAGHE